MQVKLFTISIFDEEDLLEEMNGFMRSKKVLDVSSQLINNGNGTFWCFCIRYLEATKGQDRKKEKVDYKEILDPESFQRFAKYREIRKKISNEEAIPAYAVFNNEELSELAKIKDLTLAKMKKIKGIGDKKAEKYAPFFIAPKSSHEKA